MRVGASTARFWWHERDLLNVLGFISEYFSVAEIWVEPPFYPNWRTTREKADLDKLLDVLVVTELETTIHAPYHEMSLCSWNPAVTALTLKEITKTLELAVEIESKAVTFHPGRIRLDEEYGIRILRENLEGLDDIASEYSVKLCLENPHDGHLSKVENVVEVTKGLRNIYLTLDLAHLSLQKTDLSGYKTLIKRRVKNAHLSRITADGKHKPLLTENAFMKNSLKIMKNAGYRGALILEGFVGENPERKAAREVNTVKKMISF